MLRRKRSTSNLLAAPAACSPSGAAQFGATARGRRTTRMNVLAVEPGNAKALETRGATHGAVTIGLSGISKDYSGVAALTEVNLEFYAGEVHAVLGENGAGKSTLMGVISGVTQPDAGEILFEGRADLRCRRRRPLRSEFRFPISTPRSSRICRWSKISRSRCRDRCSKVDRDS